MYGVLNLDILVPTDRIATDRTLILRATALRGRELSRLTLTVAQSYSPDSAHASRSRVTDWQRAATLHSHRLIWSNMQSNRCDRRCRSLWTKPDFEHCRKVGR